METIIGDYDAPSRSGNDYHGDGAPSRYERESRYDSWVAEDGGPPGADGE